MYWGAGPALGLLTILGYRILLASAARFWRNRDDLLFWMHGEACVLRRSFSRYTAVGPFYSPREESRLKSFAACFFSSLSRFPRSRVQFASLLFFVGFLLFLLDFFI